MSKSEQIESIAKAVCVHFFSSMINPKFRGPNFKFKTYNIEDRAVLYCKNCFKKQLSSKQVDLCKKIAKDTWQELLENSDVVNLIDNQPISR